MTGTHNYSRDRKTEENLNTDEKYSQTGESEFSRESTIPVDEDEVLSERHYTFSNLEKISKRYSRSRHPRSEPRDPSYRGRGPRGYRRSDETIQEDVCRALYRSGQVDASEIEVVVRKGEVTLKGWVETQAQKDLAESAVENLSGIEAIFNEIRVRVKGAPEKPSPFGLTNNITGLN